jgi:hypothetical protein
MKPTPSGPRSTRERKGTIGKKEREKGQTLSSLRKNDLTQSPIRFGIGVQRLPNGNTVFCNWLGHGHLGENPHLYEVTPEKQLVWSFADHAHFKAVTQVQILDEGFLAKPWELER